MATGYILIAAVVVLLHIAEVPAVFVMIVKSAFGLMPAFAGGLGAAIAMGVRRGLFSNEAGLGSAPNVAAVAYVRHPGNQGIVQAFSVFIDTLIICSCTAFMILLSSTYSPELQESSGVALTQTALASHVGEWGRSYVSIALMLFAFAAGPLDRVRLRRRHHGAARGGQPRRGATADQGRPAHHQRLRRAAPRRDRAAGPRSREVRRSQPSTATPGRLSSLRERWRSQR
jgi:hypothetical protein